MNARNVLLGFAAACFVSAGAHATCFVPYSFASYGYDPSTYQYVHFGPDSVQSTEAIVGRFWEVGARENGNEGTYDDSRWMTEEGPDKWDYQGWLGSYGVVGCIRNEMIMLLQDTTVDGSDAMFVAGRVHLNGYAVHEFPFWLTGGDWNAVKFPTACRKRQTRAGSTVIVDLAVDDIAGGFHGEPGMLPKDTVTGYSIWVARGHSDPGRSTAVWTHLTTVPYSGTSTTLTDVQVDCSGPGDAFIAVGVEFDHGQFTSDFVGKPTRIICDRWAADPSDADADGAEDRCDNCPNGTNADQRDSDRDGVGDACDRTQLPKKSIPREVGILP